MRLAGVVAAFAVLFGVSTFAVRLGDRELFVSPPESVAEGFVRELIPGRYAQARAYLLAGDAMSEESLRGLREGLIQRVGTHPADYDASVVTSDPQSARVRIILTSERRSQTIELVLRFEGHWKIDSFPVS